ncbi:GNAT family N-acetyltransferase [Leptolyngbya sp. CCNP1308]|uniref:GNAT family N-acetyltransferase n=1 Tax=Leptolyngbya sp. CCNP1308 TaxID=3110255 RepID=UPI002B1F83DE|nr:GNAT family N-acetyltransferase [Leptolyngbya sp. CCNP1308]MEA5447514.1 GNAT family N-acetyltransferase [Leptolyngbya sp. CCNP1308]
MGYLSCQAPCQDDIAALVALDHLALGGLWSAEGYGREIDSPNSCLLMLVHSPYGSQGPGGDLSTASMAGLKTSSPPDPQTFQSSPGVQGRSRPPHPPRLGAVEPSASRGAADPASLESSGEPILLGLGCYWAILDEAHITVLAIDPRYQRRGLGKWLLVNLLTDACDRQRPDPDEGHRTLTRATLEVRPSNSRALALYESFGFETLGLRRRYYADGEDALILWQNSLKTAEFRDRLQQQRSAARHQLGRQGWQITDKKLPLNRT